MKTKVTILITVIAVTAANLFYNYYKDKSFLDYNNEIQGEINDAPEVEILSRDNLSHISIETQQEFYAKFAPYASYVWKNYGILPSVVLAQFALESGWGKKSIGYNIAGIKASPGDTKVVEVLTKEHSDNPNAKFKNVQNKYKVNNYWVYEVVDKFRYYDSYFECIDDYCKKLTTQNRYKDIVDVRDYVEAIGILKKGGYATDKDYTTKIVNIIRRERLYVLDMAVALYDGETEMQLNHNTNWKSSKYTLAKNSSTKKTNSKNNTNNNTYSGVSVSNPREYEGPTEMVLSFFE